MKKINELEKIAKLLRYYVLTSTTKAGSGHPTSCLSSIEIVTSLFFGGYFQKGDHFILSKGHAVPLIYSLYTVLGLISEEELMTLRKFNSLLQGHPIPDDFLIEAATGSLGQGLSIGLGMALENKINPKNKSKIWVLLGDSELAEGQIWEAVQIASYYQLDNLIAITDINRLGQRGETMLGWNMNQYQKRFRSFDWETIAVDGHSFIKLNQAFEKAKKIKKPLIILAKTIKGKGISFLENKDNWHGKPLKEDELNLAIKELREIEKMTFKLDSVYQNKKEKKQSGKTKKIINQTTGYSLGQLVATRKAYGNGLVNLGKVNNEVVVLDAETSNSTYAETFKKTFPHRFFEMFIAEQNMISVGLGLSKMGYIPFVSSFAAFLTRGFDQIRMSQYSNPNLKIVGSHAGVSIGEDGPSQMGLEDLAMMRSILNSVVLYPADAVSTEKLVFEAAKYNGLVYLRTTRKETPVIYPNNEEFPIGGLKIHAIKVKQAKEKILIVAAGITLFEALKAQKELVGNKIETIVVDCYSVKPIDKNTLNNLVKNVKKIIIVEDHYPAGGLGEAVKSVLLPINKPIYHLAVNKIPRSGKPEELLDYEEISAKNIIKKVLNEG